MTRITEDTQEMVTSNCINGIEVPKRIWLTDEGSGDICWANDPDPTGDGYAESVEYVRVDQASERDALRAEVLRLVDALAYAHGAGFEWPTDPLPFGSLAHDLFIWRGNDPDRIEARAALSPNQGAKL